MNEKDKALFILGKVASRFLKVEENCDQKARIRTTNSGEEKPA